MSLPDNQEPKDRRRSARPERLVIGDEEMVRNDVIAREEGACEKTVNRRDKDGAPFLYMAGVKYRPIRRYHQFLLGLIQSRNQPPLRRRRRA
jgi:hypothetical protein